MTNDEWDALMRRREAQARSDPAGYRRHVRAWAVGGYAFLLGALALAAGAVIALAVAILAGVAPLLLVKLAIPIGVLAFMIARSLFVRVPPPTGIELNEVDAPALFETLERLRRQVDAPRIHKVLLDGDFNASVVQIPRLGALGWQRNYLTVGLPFMQALSPEEFSSVLAHELGHISGSHGRFSAWVYRLRSSWSKVMEQLDGHGHVGAGAFRRFFHWYVPRFGASTVALVRAHEYEADRAAAEAVGARPTALALVRSALAGSAETRYWNALYDRVIDEPAPPRCAYTGLADALPAVPDQDATTTLRRALAQPTDTGDTHPSLSDRLAALGYLPDELQGDDSLAPPEDTAAERLLGSDAHVRLAERLSLEWCESARPGWAERHAEAREELRRLEQLDERAAHEALDINSRCERARLTEELRGKDAALERWREVLTLDPSDPAANLAVAACLLNRDDDQGLKHLDRAASASPSAAIYAAEMGYAYESGRGHSDDAARYRSHMNANLDMLSAAADERRSLTKKDPLEPHDLTREDLSALSLALSDIDQLASAYLVRKRLGHLADEAPLYVLGVAPATPWWRYERTSSNEKMIEQVVNDAPLPGEFLVVPLTSENKWLRKRVEQIDRALIFAR